MTNCFYIASIDSEIKKTQNAFNWLKWWYIYVSIYLIYTAAKIKILMAIFSGSTERNSIKLGMCGEGMDTK